MAGAVLAVVFDFDDTLVPDSTSKLLAAKNIDPGKFWADAKQLVLRGYDPSQAFLKLFLDNVGSGKPLGELTNRMLHEFGASLDSEFFPGIPEIFDDLRRDVSKYRDINIEFYIISGGLQPIIEGTRLVRDGYISAVYASQLDGDDNGVLRYVMRCVTFTEKTRYLFEINKGLSPSETLRKPHLVNKAVPVHDRRIPFRNMIYVGDGLTDIPCFSLVRKGTAGEHHGGFAFGVFDRGRKDPKTAFREFLKENRVSSLHFPRYREEDELGTNLRGAVVSRCAEITLGRSEAETDAEIE